MEPAHAIDAVENDLYAEFPPLERVESLDRHTPRLPALQLLPMEGIGAELGVFAGFFSKVLYRVSKPKKLYMVDGWTLIFGKTWPNWGQYNDFGRLTPIMAMEAAHRRAAALEGKAEVVVSRTVEWLRAQPDRSLDWVYSDSGHTYDNTLAELRELNRVLAEDGVIVGDDCQIDRAHRHFSVFRAVRDFCRESQFEIIYMDHAKQWAIRRIQD